MAEQMNYNIEKLSYKNYPTWCSDIKVLPEEKCVWKLVEGKEEGPMDNLE